VAFEREISHELDNKCDDNDIILESSKIEMSKSTFQPYTSDKKRSEISDCET